MPEGTIVRVITRLDETCREVRDAARVIGDADLFTKMEEAQALIKRDSMCIYPLWTEYWLTLPVVFAASLVCCRVVGLCSDVAVADDRSIYSLNHHRSHRFEHLDRTLIACACAGKSVHLHRTTYNDHDPLCFCGAHCSQIVRARVLRSRALVSNRFERLQIQPYHASLQPIKQTGCCQLRGPARCSQWQLTVER